MHSSDGTPHLRGILNLPAAEIDSALRRSRKPDCIIVGVPFDGGSAGVAGARHGPEIARMFSPAIPWRANAEGVVDHVIDATGSNLLSDRLIIDGGNVVPFPLDPRIPRVTTFEAISSVVRAVGLAGSLPVLVGGDHSISAPAVGALAELFESLSVVVLDAHVDIDADDSNEFARLYNANVGNFLARIQRATVTVLGARDFRSAVDRNYSCVRVVPASELRRMSADAAAAILPEGPTYLSVDMDVLDPSAFPATGHPLPGGCSVPELLDVAHAIAFARPIVGFDVVEFVYEAAHNEFTGLIVGSLIIEVLRGALAKPRLRVGGWE